MSIFDKIEETKEQKIQDYVNEIKQYMKGAQESSESAREVIKDMIFNNTSFTPQEILNLFKDDAKELIEMLELNTKYAEVMKPTNVSTKIDFEYTFDGKSIIIGKRK